MLLPLRVCRSSPVRLLLSHLRHRSLYLIDADEPPAAYSRSRNKLCLEIVSFPGFWDAIIMFMFFRIKKKVVALKFFLLFLMILFKRVT